MWAAGINCKAYDIKQTDQVMARRKVGLAWHIQWRCRAELHPHPTVVGAYDTAVGTAVQAAMPTLLAFWHWH